MKSINLIFIKGSLAVMIMERVVAYLISNI
jgi:hypothetical protein